MLSKVYNRTKYVFAFLLVVAICSLFVFVIIELLRQIKELI